jgi:hypothetical protein
MKIMKRFLLCLLFSPVLIFPQPENPEWRNYTFSNTATFIRSEGDFLWLCTTGGLIKFHKSTNEKVFFNKGNSFLPSNSITALDIDSDGYKWAATLNGLVKFKDNEWYIFNKDNSGLPSNKLSSIIIDDYNIKWIGTIDSGLVEYDGVNWTIFNKHNSPLTSNFVKALLYHNNALWIGTNSGAVKKTGNSFQLLAGTQNSNINGFDIDQLGNLWIASHLGLHKLTSDVLIPITFQNVEFIKTDNRNIKWFGSKQPFPGTAGLHTVDSTDLIINQVQYINSMITFPLFDYIYSEDDGTKWLGTYYGLLKVKQSSGTLFHTSNAKLGVSKVEKVFIDSHYRKWFYNWDLLPIEGNYPPPGYLSLFHNNIWEKFDNQNSPIMEGGVNALAEGADSNMYLSLFLHPDNTRLYKFSAGIWTEVSNPGSSINYMWYDVETGDLYVNYNNASYSLYRLRNNAWYQVNITMPWGYVVNDMKRRGIYIWLATNQGLIRYDGNNHVVYNIQNSGLPHNVVTSLDFDGTGNIWLGTDKGLAKFDGSTNWVIYNSLNSPMSSENVSSIVVDSSNHVYIGNSTSFNGNSAGLLKFDGTNWIIFNNSNSGKPDNPLWMPPEDITDLALDATGKLWMTSPGGIGVYDKHGVPVPVELVSFNASAEGNNINLNWSTASEINNRGFEVQRYNGVEWMLLTFIEGKGTTAEYQNYLYTERNVGTGKYRYRLKQVDFDGSYSFSAEVEVEITIPGEFYLHQNYPNPFNPSTKIKFGIGSRQHILLKVYDVLGREAAVLTNEFKEAGEYEIDFNASYLSSGVYYYSIQAGDFFQTKKLILVK